MKPISFEGCNIVFAENQPEYNPLPALLHLGESGHILCAWKLTIRERIQLLFKGILWHQILTFGKPLQPQKLTTDKPTYENPT